MALVTFGKYADSLFRCELEHDPDYRYATYVLGTQGTGKSTLLGHIAEQCAAAGEGVLVIDTKGELAVDIVSRTRQPDRLIYVAPTAHLGSKRYWALNPLELDRSIPGAEDRLVSNLGIMFDRMALANSASMPLVESNLTWAARLAYGLPQPTLPDVIRLFDDAALRTRLYRSPDVDDEVKRHWQEEYDGLSERARREMSNSTLRRLKIFLSAPVINRMITPPHSTIRLETWLDQGKLVVCNFGPSFRVGIGTKNSRLLANFLIAQLNAVATTRPSINQERRRIWRVIVDEFQELAVEPFLEMISQIRKYQVFPVLANQNLSQLNDELRNTALTCHVRFFLGTSGEDARLIRGVTGDEEAGKLAHYPDHQARAHLPGRGGPRRFRTIKLANWWAERSNSQLAQAIGRAEDDRFTLPEAWFVARRQSTVAAPPTGATNGTAAQSNGIDAWERPDQAAQDDIPVSVGSPPAARVSAAADPPGGGDSQPPRRRHVLDHEPGG